MKSLITSRMRAAPVLTWATFPGPTLAPVGLYFFSDIGINGSFWYNSGATLNPVDPIVLSRLSAQVASSNGTAEEAYAISSKIPAGVLKTGRKIQIYSTIVKSGTVESTSSTFKIGTNANGITGATSISSALAVSTTNRHWCFESAHQVMSDTTLQQTTAGGSLNPYGASTSVQPGPRTVPNMASNDLYISLTGTKTTGGIETITAVHFDVVLS
jgi:hypothetical protein